MFSINSGVNSTTSPRRDCSIPIDNIAAARLLQTDLKERPQLFEPFALVQGSQRFLHDFAGIAVAAGLDPLPDHCFELGGEGYGHCYDEASWQEDSSARRTPVATLGRDGGDVPYQRRRRDAALDGCWSDVRSSAWASHSRVPVRSRNGCKSSWSKKCPDVVVYGGDEAYTESTSCAFTCLMTLMTVQITPLSCSLDRSRTRLRAHPRAGWLQAKHDSRAAVFPRLASSAMMIWDQRTMDHAGIPLLTQRR